ncbi:hypothetical protein [Planctomycetes bacterium CA13]|uniref:hypothetical protein n=1 Tax=Novipirellula herctigrandis TaxID=2527986 RepID=UPI0011B7EAD0
MTATSDDAARCVVRWGIATTGLYDKEVEQWPVDEAIGRLGDETLETINNVEPSIIAKEIIHQCTTTAPNQAKIFELLRSIANISGTPLQIVSIDTGATELFKSRIELANGYERTIEYDVNDIGEPPNFEATPYIFDQIDVELREEIVRCFRFWLGENPEASIPVAAKASIPHAPKAVRSKNSKGPQELRDERDDALLDRFGVDSKKHPSYPDLAKWLETVSATNDWTPIEASSMRDALRRAWGRRNFGLPWPFDGRGKGKRANKETRIKGK